MGFSIRRFLNEATAQVNPFDGGKTAATVRANRAPAPPAQTKSNQGSVASRVVDQINPFDNGRTFKQRTPTNQNSSVYQMSHNGLSNVVGGVGKAAVAPAAYFVNTDIVNPARQVAAQVTGNRVALRNAEQDQNALLTPQKIAGNTAGLALNVVAPGASRASTALVGRVASKPVANVAGNALAGAAVGAPMNVAAVAGEGQLDRHNVLKTAGQGALGGAVLGGGIPAAGYAARAAVKAVPAPKPVYADYQPEVNAKASQTPSTKLVQPQPVTRKGGFVQSVQSSPEASAEVRKQVSSDYNVRNTAALAQDAEKFAKQPINKARDQINERLAVPMGQIDDRTVADAIATAKKLDGKGQHDAASAIYEGLDEHLRASGQSVQAASLLSNRTPEGLKFKAERDLRKAGVKPTPELRAKLDKALEAVRKAKTPEEKNYATLTYAKLVGDQLPSDLVDKGVAVWKAGLLSGIKTQTGNALSNATFGALHDVSNPLAVMIDRAISLKTGVRTKTLTTKGRVAGAVEGTQNAGRYLKTGVDELGDLGNKFDQKEIPFKNKAARVYVNGIFRAMGAADKPFRYSQLRNSLYDLAKADGLTKGLKGRDLNAYIETVALDPPKAMLQRATDEAAKAVLGNDTYLSKAAGRIRQAADDIENPAGRAVAKAATGVLMPFTKVPSAFIGRVLDFTPVGPIKEIAAQIGRGTFDQRALSTALSEGATGTSIIYLGAELANNGMISGPYPDDPKEQARWKAEGIQPNSVRIYRGQDENGEPKYDWVSLNYFGPVGALFNQGKRAQESLAESGAGPLGKATDLTSGFSAGAVQDALGQSFLSGISGALDAVSDPKRYGESYVRNQAGSIVPTLSKDVAESTDKYQRDTNNPLQAIQARIPGARKSLDIKQDVYGNKLERKAGPVSTLANPLRPSKSLTNDVIGEVNRLHNVDPNNKDLQVTPTPVDKTLVYGGQRIKLTPEQRYRLQERIGQATQTTWGQFMKTPEYKAMTDTEKAQALNQLRTGVTDLAKRQYAAETLNLGADKEASARLVKLSKGDILGYLGKSSTSKAASTSSKKKATVRASAARRTGSRKGRSGASKSVYKLTDILDRDLTVNKSLRKLLKEAKL